MVGLPPDLNRELRAVLLRCGPFDSNGQLLALFVDSRLRPWRDRVPEASSRQARVQALIALLVDAASAEGENALVLFLQALQEWVDPGTACYQHLGELARAVSEVVAGGTSTPRRSTASRSGADASLTGDGAIAQGEGATAVGAGGVIVEGDVGGDVVTGSKETTFDQRGSNAGQVINVAGNYYDHRGAPPAPDVGAGDATPDRGEAAASLDLPALRRRLDRLDSVELESLCLDHFPAVYDKFARGMRRDEMVNLLLAHCRRRPEAAARLDRLL